MEDVHHGGSDKVKDMKHIMSTIHKALEANMIQAAICTCTYMFRRAQEDS